MTDELIIRGVNPSDQTALWICLTWTKHPGIGWNSGSKRFKTEAEAVAFGREHIRELDPDDISRCYKVITVKRKFLRKVS